MIVSRSNVVLRDEQAVAKPVDEIRLKWGIGMLSPIWVAVPLGIALSLSSMGLASPASAAEFPPCPPPSSNEYLLLIPGQTEAERTRAQELLPSSTPVIICDYLANTVVRAGGFTSLESANAWAQYLTEVEGLQAFVARPAAPTETQATDPATASSTAATAYNPQPLGVGYAILVDYDQQPSVAGRLQQLTNAPVGLAVYQQQPYLLAAQSTDASLAGSVLKMLSDGNFSVLMVDSRQVVRLSSEVVISQGE